MDVNDNEFLMEDENSELDDNQTQTDKDESEDIIPEGSSEEDDSSMPADDSGPITSYEYELSKSYDDLVGVNDLTVAVQIVISANPINNSGIIVGEKLKEFLHLQGKARIVGKNSFGLLSGSDVESIVEDDDSGEINERKEREARDLIWRFVKYLAERDLSKDSTRLKRIKLRHIPALIIYLFSNKMYGLIINCPYLPEEYQVQVSNALKKINDRKYELVEELAQLYESAGSTQLAEKVRKLKLTFFDYEPAELRISAEFRDIEIKNSDILIYKTVRNKYVNISKSVTQEVASDLIEVVIDKDSGISEKLKDKVRTEAINNVKALLKEFAENSSSNKDNEIAISILLNK